MHPTNMSQMCADVFFAPFQLTSRSVISVSDSAGLFLLETFSDALEVNTHNFRKRELVSLYSTS